MKKKMIFAAIMLTACMALGAAACDGTSDEREEQGGVQPPQESETPVTPPTQQHTHHYERETIKPTCTERGYMLYTCSCGDSYKDDYVDIINHSGYGKCENCGLNFFETIGNDLPANEYVTHGSGSKRMDYSFHFSVSKYGIDITGTAEYPAYGTLLGRFLYSFRISSDSSWSWETQYEGSNSAEFMDGELTVSAVEKFNPKVKNIPYDLTSPGITRDMIEVINSVTTTAVHDIISVLQEAIETQDGITLENLGFIGYVN